MRFGSPRVAKSVALQLLVAGLPPIPTASAQDRIPPQLPSRRAVKGLAICIGSNQSPPCHTVGIHHTQKRIWARVVHCTLWHNCGQSTGQGRSPLPNPPWHIDRRLQRGAQIGRPCLCGSRSQTIRSHTDWKQRSNRREQRCESKF